MAKRNILIIDDDQDLIESVKTILTKEGFNIFSSNTGKEVKKEMLSKRPDLVIMDIMLSNMTEGFDIARELKDDDELKDIPVILMTALQLVTEFDDKRRSMDWLPGNSFIEKPFTPEDLLKKVKNSLKIKT